MNGALAREIATRLYGVTPRARSIPSDEADVFVLEFGGALPDKVIKLERPGGTVVWREQRLLPYLRTVGLDVPDLEHSALEYPVAEGAAGAPVAPAAVIVMPFIPSRSVPDIWAEDPAAARRLAERLGRFAARLHALPVVEVPAGWSAHTTRHWLLVWWNKQRANLQSFPGRSERYERVFALARGLLEREPTRFGHGQGYQTLADGRDAFAVIDWGSAGVYWPLADLAQAIGALKVWSGVPIAADLLPWMLEAYLDGRTLSEQEQAELAIWEAYQALASAVSLHRRGRVDKSPFQLALAEQILRDRPDVFGHSVARVPLG